MTIDYIRLPLIIQRLMNMAICKPMILELRGYHLLFHGKHML